MTNTKRVLIYGAGSDIALALTGVLLDRSHKVALVTRVPNQLPCPMQPHAIALPGTSWRDYADVAQAAAQQLGGIDAVVNCMGSLLLKPIHLTREEEFDEQIHLHLKSSAGILAATLPHLRKSDQPDKSMVFISSIAAGRGLANHEAISAAKGGIEALVRSAAATDCKQGIRINCVAPSLTTTKLTERIWNQPAMRTRAEGNHPLARIGNPSDVASAIFWLLSNHASWVTGTVIPVDGGLRAIQNI
jgi:NAD(P)-dependent dehydrogenase (short-subunit alcohol dehydrogenase family)